MVGSPVIAGFVAHVAFWVLLAWGWANGTLGPKSTGIAVSLWLAAFLGLLRVPYVPFASIVAMLDIALVLIVFRGDVRLT